MLNRTQILCWEGPRACAPTFRCSQCGGEIFPGESYYDVCGEIICRECLEYFARRALSRYRRRCPDEGACV